MNRKIKIKAILVNIKIFFGIKRHSYLDSKETIDYVLAHNKSLIRWGDGETSIVLGNSICFQKADEDLARRLYEVLKSYDESSKYLFGAPNLYLEASLISLLKIKKARTWFYTRYLIEKTCKKPVVFGDAFTFRPLSPLENDYIEKLWIGHNVIFVHSNEEYYKDFVTKYPDIRSDFVAIDAENAYSHIAKTMEEIKDTIRDNMFEKDNTKILIVAGPAARVLAYDLSMMGYTAYDMGHYFHWKFLGISNEKGI